MKTADPVKVLANLDMLVWALEQEESHQAKTLADCLRAMCPADVVSSTGNLATTGYLQVLKHELPYLPGFEELIWPPTGETDEQRMASLRGWGQKIRHSEQHEAKIYEPWADETTPRSKLYLALDGPPTPMQVAIWNALDGRAMKTDDLALEVANGDRPRLYYTDRKTKKGGLKEMKEAGCVALKRPNGYYRPDAPSATN